MKSAIVIGAYTLIVLPLVAALIYFKCFSPKARASQHLSAVHSAIHDMHPAMTLEPDFSERHKRYFQRAKSQLPWVQSVADEQALVKFYLNQYRDKHLAGTIVNSPFTRFENADQWAGFLLEADMSGFRVIYSPGTPDTPPLDARLTECDGESIDTLLERYYAPYVDLRWDILNARDKAAKLLTQKGLYQSVIKRPNITKCRFTLANGEPTTFTFRWRSLSDEDRDAIGQFSTASYVPPSLERLAPRRYWVYVSDFQLNSPKAAEQHRNLLDELRGLPDSSFVVLDTRANQGGNSSLGNEILHALVGDDNMRALTAKAIARVRSADARYRASYKMLHAHQHLLEQVEENQGQEAETALWLRALIARNRHALETDSAYFWQSEVMPDEPSSPDRKDAELPQWNYSGKIAVITEKSCISACLDFVDTVKLIPGALHMGQPTDADTAYTEVVPQWHTYAGEKFQFVVPVKRWRHRLRDDNQPYQPDIIYPGNIYDTSALQAWVESMASEAGFYSNIAGNNQHRTGANSN